MKSRLWVLAMMGLWGASCATPRVKHMYDGPARPADEVAHIEVSGSLAIKDVDGVKTSDGLIPSAYAKSFFLQPGRREIGLVYYEIWPTAEDEHESIRSEKFTVTLEARPGKRYQIDYPRPPNLGAALTFAASPRVNIMHAGQVVAPVSTPLPRRTESEPAGSQKPDPKMEALPAGSSNSDLMQFWWNNASGSERREFQEWMNRQNRD